MCTGQSWWIADNACDDVNNNEGCQWDGGDCCGDDVNTVYCMVCECLDPNDPGSIAGTKAKTTPDTTLLS